MKKFSQAAAAELFNSYLKGNGFKALPHDAGKAAMAEILTIDYRPYLGHPDFATIYQNACVAILVKHGSTPENATIFAEAIQYLTNGDNGFKDQMQEFIDRFVRNIPVPPEDIPRTDFSPSYYGQIGLQGFDPSIHLTEAGEFDFAQPTDNAVNLYHDPDSGLTISAGLSAIGAVIAVSGPVTPAVMIVGAALILGAVILNKVLKKSC